MSGQPPIIKSAKLEGHFEAAVVGVLMRACPVCQSPHPRARGIQSDKCECGWIHDAPQEFVADQTAITGGGFSLGIAKALLTIAMFLNNLAKRI